MDIRRIFAILGNLRWADLKERRQETDLDGQEKSHWLKGIGGTSMDHLR